MYGIYTGLVFEPCINKFKFGNLIVTSRRNRKANHVPLIVEPHPEDYDGYPFITLLQYRDKHILTVVDNATEKAINAFVLDLCNPEGLNEEFVIAMIAEWYENDSANYPLSIEFSKKEIAGDMSRIYRSYNIDFVTRVMGPLPKFNMVENKTIRRRRKRSIPDGIVVTNLVAF